MVWYFPEVSVPPLGQGANAVNLDLLKAIAKEFDSLDESEATPTEVNIARLLINAGLLTIETETAEAYGDRPEQSWKEFKVKS